MSNHAWRNSDGCASAPGNSASTAHNVGLSIQGVPALSPSATRVTGELEIADVGPEACGRLAQHYRAINGIPSMSNSQLNLVHCVYCSASTRTPLSSAELESLLAECRHNNSKADITGILLYRNGSFFQVLEGEQPTVEALFDRIGLDKRHHQTKKIIFETIATRSFAAWTMGFPKITSKELATIPGLSDFFHHGTSYIELGEGRAKSLLAAFKEGKWRASLS
jgi:hypothetical protein